jgi:hypothetical protein
MSYDTPTAAPVDLPAHGGPGGTLNDIALQRGEFVKTIRGKYGALVDSMTIVTNFRTYGPFGGTGGSNDYSYSAPVGSEIIGFTGRSGALLDAVGVMITTR